MITVHHLNNSRSQRVLWLLEELGLPYDIKHYQRNAVTNLAPPELLQVHPLGKSPVITDGDVTVAETGAIIEYLVDRAGGRLRPSAGTPEHRRYTYWLHFAEGSAMPPLVMTLVLGRIKKAGPFFVRPIARRIAGTVLDGFVMPNIKRQLNFMEAELAGRPWFAGNDEFPARSGGSARWAWRAIPAACRLPGAHPRAARLPGGAQARWPVRHPAVGSAFGAR
jgi:glutathione S-transferase